MNKRVKQGEINMKHVYLVVYVGELYGIYYKASHMKYNVFSSKRKAKKYINSKVSHLPGGKWGEREQEKRKYLIYKKVIDNEN